MNSLKNKYIVACRITARSIGARSNTIVMLQSTIIGKTHDAPYAKTRIHLN